MKKLILSIFLISSTSLISLHASDEHNLTDTQLNAVLVIITNFILSSDTAMLSIPTLTTTAPTETINNSLSIELNGQAGTYIFVNDEYKGIIGENGKASITLNLSLGTNSFSIILKDDILSTTSNPLSFTIRRNEFTGECDPMLDLLGICEYTPTIIETPTLTNSILAETTAASKIIEINGQAGTYIFINDEYKGIVGENGKSSLTLNLSLGDNLFSIILKDDVLDTISNTLSLTITRNEFTGECDPILDLLGICEYTPTTIETPTLTYVIPNETNTSFVLIELNGKANTSIYINNEYKGIIGENGKASITLNLSVGMNSFSIYLDDGLGNTSSPLSLTITRNDTTEECDPILQLLAQCPTPPIIIETPTLTNSIPTETIADSKLIEINGQAGTHIYINDAYMGIIGENGKADITLSLSLGDNPFSIVLKDSLGNTSSPLFFSITRNEDSSGECDPLFVLLGGTC